MAEGMAPWLTYCLEQFGTTHCMFESNVPVDTVSYAHHVRYKAFTRLSAGYAASERTALFHDTAVRV